jgi:hypothetical protein
VMAGRKITHGVTCGNRTPTQREPDKCQAQNVGALLIRGKRDR